MIDDIVGIILKDIITADIDKAYIMGQSYDDNAIYIGWSPYFNYDSLETLQASKTLPIPKGIKITLSIGKKATFEEVVEKKFSEVKLASEYPEIYEACKVEVKTSKEITKASNDRLVITLPKEEE